MVFLMTTAAGSALWASEIEKKRALLNQPGSRPDEYHDEP